ncbi:hypothetical protein A7985_08455 [Pseudoalteromonas luteoviolacea]|uniref:Carbamoyl transferase n=1 Tax=Pseudoalteromonas luteoviolacea TaxID=43657 RepID=A0A1C0TXB0_9GAMM|nr:carbamoyltransferase C-terminal domain-containing protein [Pseudoalteromonas luteoviolacea]MBQ4810464.1 hypothetical protein [Pseudoalteromonas luteoviolacea]OCQ23952.1 hypothetical protein A7985_08455 [Pseudoalteromonas luteoviolacea]
MYILGIHGGVRINQHDPSAALIKDGVLCACIEEERLLKVKGPRGTLPIRAIQACLEQEGITIHDVDYIAHPGETYEDMPPKIDRYMRYYFGHCPPVKMINHQLCHLASSFYHAPFDDAMCISYDAYGDRQSAAYATATRETGIDVIETVNYDNSLGHYYGVMTSYLGFRPAEGEYMVMGLAPYGEEKYNIDDILCATEDGYKVNTSYFNKDVCVYEPYFNEKMTDLLGPSRKLSDPIDQRFRDIAKATQVALEQSVISVIKYVHEKTGKRKLCLSGGVALNCSANHLIRNLDFIDELFVQPAASDRGIALGAALQLSYEKGALPTPVDHVFYGPDYSDEKIRHALELTGNKFIELEDPYKTGAELIAEGQIIGWFQGRSEYGPRALGHRSILADPRNPNMKDMINARVKFRDEFRPFAPAVCAEFASTCFDMEEESPFMTIVYPVRKEWHERIPAVTHVNGSARVQTVSEKSGPGFYPLVKHFGQLTGVPVVLNTSFNIKGQPIVETPFDALATFASTGLDAVIIGKYLVTK